MSNPNLSKVGIRFSKTNQPKNRRQSTKVLTELIVKNLKGKREVHIDGIDIKTGEKTTIKVLKPTKEVLILKLLEKAYKGDMAAMNMIFDRVEGKPTFTADVQLPGIDFIGFDDGPEE